MTTLFAGVPHALLDVLVRRVLQFLCFGAAPIIVAGLLLDAPVTTIMASISFAVGGVGLLAQQWVGARRLAGACLFLLLGATLFCQAQGLGVNDVAAQFSPVCVLLASFLLRPRALAVFGGVAVVGSVSVAIAHAAGWLPNALPSPGGVIDFVLAPVVMTGTTALLLFTVGGAREAYAENAVTAARLRALFDAAGDGLLVLDDEGRISYANPAFCGLCGTSVADLVGRDPAGLGHLESTNNGLEEWRCGEGDDAKVVEVRRRPRQGDLPEVWNARDVTQARARTRQAHLDDKMRALGTLAAGIAHDVNNQLTGIIGLSDELAEMRPDDPLAQRLTAEIRQAGERASARTAPLLGHRRAATGRLVAVRSVIDDVCAVMRHQLDARVQVVVGEVAPLGVSCPAAELENVLLNLALNGSQAMPQGGTLTISAAHNGDTVVITVADTGVGMSAEAVQRATEPFFTTRASGTGLGLFNAARFCATHDGRLEIASTPGQGTVVTVQLPAAALQATPTPLPVPPPAVRETLDGVRVLLAEDDALVARAVSRQLRRLGCTVTHVEDGTAALQAVEGDSQAYDLVLTDLNMPGLTGVELVDALDGTGIDVPVLLISGNADRATIDRVTSSGRHGFLTKPFRSEQLFAALLERTAQVHARASA